MTAIYLDYNSTTPLDPAVAAFMADVHQLQLANPASQHQAGQRARRRLDQEKHRILELLNARTRGHQQDRLIVTSGGTESNNLAIAGIARAVGNRVQGSASTQSRVLVSATEHPCILGAADALGQQGFATGKIAVGSDGRVSLESLSQQLDDRTVLVGVQLANHETGVIQPIQDVVRICRQFPQVVVHCDAAQAVGKIAVDFQELDVDALTVSAHKFYGPRGVGGLIVRHGLPVEPLMFGGFQQLGSRPGTEDIALVAGMAEALQMAIADLTLAAGRMSRLQTRLETTLAAAADAGKVRVAINGHLSNRLPNTSNVAFPGCNRQSLLMAADMQQLFLSTGSACASGSSEPSPVLVAMNLPQQVVDSSLRISLGRPTTDEEVDLAANILIETASRLANQDQ